MSTDPSKKRKDKKKKKAMLEALQQEEYQEERAHVQQLEDVDEDFIVYPADDSDDTAPLLEESDGSGACAKIVFLVLLSSLGMAIGVIFFEMGGMQTLTGLMDVESIINAPPVKYDPPTTPVDVAIDDDFDQIDPSPIEPESLKDDKSDVIADAVEAIKDLPLEVIETVTETVVVPEVVVKEIEEVIVEEPVVEEPVVEAEIVEQQTVETEAVEPVVQPTESVPEPIEELPVETVAEAVEEAIVVSENFESQLEDEPAEVPQESFTMRAEREAVQGAVDEVWVMTVRCIEELRALQVMAKSSLTHAVIDSISQRLEPLRSQLDGLVKNTSDSVFDGALEQAAELERNLRAVLGELDEARNQDTILAEEEAARQEQLAAEAVEIVSEEPEEVMAEVQEEEKVEINEEPIQGEVEIEEQEVESLHEPVVSFEDGVATEPELEVAAPEMVEEESQAETVPEAEVKEEVIAEEPEILVAPEIFEEVGQVEADQPIVEEATNVPEIIEDSVEEPEENVEQEFIENVIEPELEIATPEVFEEEAQADQPTADVVSNEVTEETVPETVESAEEQIIDAPAPEATPESDYRFLSEVEEEQEVEEPLQVATEAFVVEPEVEQVAVPVAESVKDAPSRMQNLEEADRLVDQSPAQALALMEQILEKDPLNALGLYGRARSLDSLAEVERSNARLEQSVFAYRAVLDLEDQVDDQLYLKAALRCIDRMRFRGFHGKAIRIQQRLVARFPNDIQYQNQLAVGFLLTNQPEAARTILEGVLERWPKSGFAQVHLGFILKTTFEDYDAGARWMMAGIASREEGVIDGRFYSHLGDALTRLGKHQEAQRVYLDGEKEGVFLSHQQRSLYNVDRLTGKPWWDKESTTYGHFFDLLEANWRQIRNEGVALLTLEAPEGFADESEKLRDSGDWKQYELFAQGRKNAAHCTKAPVTCTLIENYPPALCKRGQVKFSIMHPGTHVWPHTGPTNCRIRAHLGLVVPGGAQLRVGNTTDTWEEGKFIIFDDSFEHEVWHKGSSYRLVLIVDLWHPELTAEEWRSLAPI
ncbi:aspartyl/asparaginyl beta-hydroxylase-like isoform X4 [Daphnia pulicaria]|uniref:aspartyl/asparaginyl beta-hydroxylase-like isoform X4 n=1 Tax=Daphnia pulicaria TaxID=35523 RepID=UPI001EEC24E5|nr:aspartyl/asparaginyl beta-hydroxylase-like isoform X4 [Daphnia pulicaria]